MKKATAFCSCAFLAGTLAALPAGGANSVFLAASGDTAPLGELSVREGDSISLDLRMDFLDTTVGGAVLVPLDPAYVRIDAVTFDASLGDDPELRCPPASGVPSPACPGAPQFVSFGALTGLAGERLVATLSLSAIRNGTTTPSVTGFRPFSDTTGRPLDVIFLPEPGRWLALGAGTVQLFALRRWRGRRGA